MEGLPVAGEIKKKHIQEKYCLRVDETEAAAIARRGGDTLSGAAIGL
ncbi:MAG: hypothetical protein GYA86_03180 [Firmicutes bacterium]|nr:hypothetical protein [Bacillota bacterium]